jgi:hypothetical protein
VLYRSAPFTARLSAAACCEIKDHCSSEGKKMTFSRSLADDVRVTIRDLNGHLIRVLDLKIAPDIVLQGVVWCPAWFHRMMNTT